MTLLPGLELLVLPLLLPRSAPQFTPLEREWLVSFWNRPGRYQVGPPPDAAKNGFWQVRLTPEASRWFLAYQSAVGAAKAPPTQDAAATTPETAEWEAWVEAKLNYDRWQAQTLADAANAALRRRRSPHPAAMPPVPGPIPPALLAAAGNPPPFAAAVTPMEHRVTFEDGETYAYPDNVRLRPRYAYYRFPQGTVAYGKFLREMSGMELETLFAAAGMTPSEQRIMRAVSRLEGGFETVNTYDTGYVSIGFIQFVTLSSGRESLSEVLAREKADSPDDFARDFHRYGVDVNEENAIVVIDPGTGAEAPGSQAVRRIVEEKRLAAVFQRAGRHSQAFRIAQVQVAKAHYWPADDTVTITLDGQTLTGKVSEAITSEAGLATLFDRKVNRGTIAPFADVLTRIMTEHHLTSIAEAATYERDILTALKYRADFLKDKTLSQPKP